jgi:hypothetical protein
MPADPTPAPEWAVKMASGYLLSSRAHPEGHAVGLAILLAGVRDAALREAAEGLKMLRPNSEGYRRPEWDRFDFDLPCADAIDEAFDVGSTAILALVGTAPKQTEMQTPKESPRG